MILRRWRAPCFLVSAFALVSALPFVGACSEGTDDGAPAPSDGAAAASAPATAAAAKPCAPHAPKRWTADGTKGASSSVALAKSGDSKVLFVADADENALQLFDARSLEQLAVFPLEGQPTHVVVLDDGLIAVSLRGAAKVAMLELGPAPTDPIELRCSIDVPVEPMAMFESGDKLYVASGAGASLSTLRVLDGVVDGSIDVPREPRSILVDDETHTIFMSHAAGGIVTAIDPAGARPIERVDLRAGHRMKNLVEEDDAQREASQGFSLASVDMGGGHLRILAPHTSVDPGSSSEPLSGSGYGGAFEHRAIAPIVSVIDPVARRSLTRSVIGEGNSRLVRDCLLPRSAIARGEKLWVACMDIDAVVELDATVSDPSEVELRRITVPSPSAVALSGDGTTLFAWSDLARTVARVELSPKKPTPMLAKPWQRADKKRDPLVARGRVLFHDTHDARIGPSRACASCHPDGRDDGLVWTSPDGPRQTPTLAGRIVGTAPYGWFGENATVARHLEKTFERLGGTGMKSPRDKADLDALVAYVSSLPPPPARPPRDTDRARRGESIFTTRGCVRCHRGGATDGKTHDIGSGVKGERQKKFDTPSLVRVGETPPYLHDGRYATLDALLRSSDTEMIDGKTLAEGDRLALEAYLETL